MSSGMSGSSRIILSFRPKQLANQIAMRAVSRQSLERVYGKVWERGGAKGDLVRFLGPAPEALQRLTGLPRTHSVSNLYTTRH